MFKLNDLKTGDRVVLRDGRLMVVLKDTAVGSVISSFEGDAFVPLGSYTQCFTMKPVDQNRQRTTDLDIVKVMRPCIPAQVLLPCSQTIRTLYEDVIETEAS